MVGVISEKQSDSFEHRACLPRKRNERISIAWAHRDPLHLSLELCIAQCAACGGWCGYFGRSQKPRIAGNNNSSVTLSVRHTCHGANGSFRTRATELKSKKSARRVDGLRLIRRLSRNPHDFPSYGDALKVAHRIRHSRRFRMLLRGRCHSRLL